MLAPAHLGRYLTFYDRTMLGGLLPRFPGPHYRCVYQLFSENPKVLTSRVNSIDSSMTAAKPENGLADRRRKRLMLAFYLDDNDLCAITMTTYPTSTYCAALTANTTQRSSVASAVAAGGSAREVSDTTCTTTADVGAETTAGVLKRLAGQIRDLESAGRQVHDAISSGSAEMDRCLPHGGYVPGSTVELLRSSYGCGATTLALMIARQAMRDGKYLVVVDSQRQCYPNAIAPLGIPMERVIVLQPSNYADVIWGLDQALRCSAVGATIANIQHLDDRVARRLQLATEQGGGIGLFLREARVARQHPSWSEVQWLLHSPVARRTTARTLNGQNSVAGAELGADDVHRRPASITSSSQDDSVRDARWFHLELLRCSGGRAGRRIRIGVDAAGQWLENVPNVRGQYEHSGALHLAAQLAQPARRRREIAG